MHPLGSSGCGVHAEMLQALGCHLAVIVVYFVLSLDVLSLQDYSFRLGIVIFVAYPVCLNELWSAYAAYCFKTQNTFIFNNFNFD